MSPRRFRRAQVYVNGKLTMCARLTVAFFFSAFMFLCILLICGVMGGAREDAGAEAQRSKIRVARQTLLAQRSLQSQF